MLALVTRRSVARPAIVKMVRGGRKTKATTSFLPTASPFASTLTNTMCSCDSNVGFGDRRQVTRSFAGQNFFNNDYHQLIDRAGAKQRDMLANPLRFQSISERTDRSDIPASFIDNELLGKYIAEYREVPMVKNFLELSVYYQLFTHVRPKTVLEVGAVTKASALWYNDIATSLNHDCHIYSAQSIGNQLQHITSRSYNQQEQDAITFVEGDYNNIEQLFPPSKLRSLPHPWLVIGENIANVVYLSQFMTTSDYLVIENTNPNVPLTGDLCAGTSKLEALKKFLSMPVGKDFKVDTYLTDFYGYNCTWHWHGFLQKCNDSLISSPATLQHWMVSTTDDQTLQLVQAGKEKRQQLLNSPTRYQSINDREDSSVIPESVFLDMYRGKYFTNYRGGIILKNPQDLIIYHELFSLVRPRTVIELGTFSGASAAFCADTATTLGIDCHLYSVDIDQGLIHKDIKKINFKNVTFIQGDVSHIEEIFPPSMLSLLPHPWIVVDDAHHNSINVLKYFNDFMQVGDYILAEDTDPRIPQRLGIHIMYSVEESPPGGPGKLNALKTFIKHHGQDYLVDSFLTDFYGHNCTLNWHGFLRKMV